MHRITRTAMLGLLVLGGAATAAAQAPTEAADTVGTPSLSAERAARIVAFYNDPGTLHFSGRTRIPVEATITSDVAVLGGPLLLAGTIEGNVVLIDGNVELLAGSTIAGDLTVVGGTITGLEKATVRGEVTAFHERLEYARAGEYLVYQPRGAEPSTPASPSGRFLARSDLLLATGQSYNRVEGLPIAFGPVLETGGSNPFRLRGMAIYRTESGATLDPKRLGYYLRLEQELGGRRRFALGGTLHALVEPIEEWHVADLENSLATFLLRRDFRDHYEREGLRTFAVLNPAGPWRFGFDLSFERHTSLPTGSPWTLFRNQESWRPQPLVAEGHVVMAGVESRFDTRSSVTDPADGWYLTGTLERTLRADLARPAMIAAAPLPIEDPLILPAQEFTGWTRALLDLRRYNRLSPDSRLNFRLLAGGSVDGRSLPPQRQHALGGAGSLPGYSLFRLDCGARAANVYRASEVTVPVVSVRDIPPLYVPSYGCDQFALVQAEYRGKLSLRFGWGGSPGRDGESRAWDIGWAAHPDLVVFTDVARGWRERSPVEDLAADIGIGLLFGRAGIYAAAPLTGQGGMNVFIRLDPRF